MLHCAYDVTDHALTLRVPVDCLPSRLGDVLTRWLTDHGITPEEVATGRPIERQPFECAVHWRVVSNDGDVRRRITYKPYPSGTWPAPFPRDFQRATAPAKATQ